MQLESIFETIAGNNFLNRFEGLFSLRLLFELFIDLILTARSFSQSLTESSTCDIDLSAKLIKSSFNLSFLTTFEYKYISVLKAHCVIIYQGISAILVILGIMNLSHY